MPEHNEFRLPMTDSDNPDAHSDSGDYRWKPEYTRRAVESLRLPYDVRTLSDKVADLEAEVEQLRAQLAAQAGEL